MLFLISSYLLLTSLNNRDSVLKKEKNLKIDLKLLLEQQTNINNKKIAITKFKRFIDTALKLELTSTGWTTLTTDINEPVTYLELEEILNQCANNNSFYFKPEIIEIKKQLSENATGKSKAKKGVIAEGKDVNLTLKGTFIVKNK